LQERKEIRGKSRHSRHHRGSNLPSLLMVLFLCVFLIGGLVWLLSPSEDTSMEEGEKGVPFFTNPSVQIEGADALSSRSGFSDTSTLSFHQNAILSGGSAVTGTVEASLPITKPFPNGITVTQMTYSGMKKLQSVTPSSPIVFPNPLNAQSVPGILTFRGSSYRNAPSWGFSQSNEEKLEQVWEITGIGERASGDDSFVWKGTGWTGQPLIVEWPYDVRKWMNLYPEKASKQVLREVIVAALDGSVYFFDLDDGSVTRPSIYIGATVKGTPTVDPRGYPLLYLGQGDENADDKTMGFWIYSLLDGRRLFFQNGADSRSNRPSWGCADASPIISAASDTLLYPCENGLLYIYKLNTYFDINTGMLSVTPETENYAYSYLASGQSGANVGIESSITTYHHYAYWVDNNGQLVCLDLMTMQMLWMKKLGDQTDTTTVIEEEGQSVYLYIATRVETQRTDTDSYIGAAYTYKINALTGEIVWQTSFPSFSGKESGPGGAFGTAIVGKFGISDLVIFSYCRTISENEGSQIVAYNKNTGEKAWEYSMSAVSWSSPLDVYREIDKKAYILMSDSLGQIHLVDAQTGVRLDYLQLVSKKGTEEESKSGLTIESSPVVFEGRLVVGTRSGSVFAVDIL